MASDDPWDPRTISPAATMVSMCIHIRYLTYSRAEMLSNAPKISSRVGRLALAVNSLDFGQNRFVMAALLD